MAQTVKKIDQTIATTILSQLGGRRFSAMTGAKDFIALEDGVRFKIGRNGTSANTVTITLNGKDLYDLVFERVSLSRKTRDVTRKIVADASDIFAEDLTSVFTSKTGLLTSL